MTSRTLDNGLRVVVSPTPGMGVVAVNLWYDVGSRHEQSHRQGFAHLFEHLMFQGSRHVAPGEHFALVQGHGGTLNATTSFDRTNYFESVPVGALDLALWLEADRMAYLDDVLTEQNFATQVDVVAQERSQGYDNVPYGTVFEQALPLVFDADHPYGHLPIGNMAHLAQATLAEVTAFHRTFYQPGNAVLTLVGDVTESEGFAKATRYFGPLPPADSPKRELPATLPPIAAPAQLDLDDVVPAAGVWFPFRLPADAPDAVDLAAATLAAVILGEGETSRLHRRLVRGDEVAVSANVGLNRLIAGNSLGLAAVRGVPEVDAGLLASTYAEVVDRFCDEGPIETELAIAKAHLARNWLDDMATAAGRADAICGCALLFDDPEVVNRRLPLIQSVDAEQVRAAAETWLAPSTKTQVRVHPAGAAREGTAAGAST